MLGKLELRHLRGPDAPTQPGWEISFGETGNRSQFLIELIETVPEGAVIDVEHGIDDTHVTQLKPFVCYWRPARWFRSAVLGIVISKESRPLLKRVIQRVSLERQWESIKIFKDDAVFFDSHDGMYDSGPFLSSILTEAFVQSLEEKGIITKSCWFEPERKARSAPK